MRHDFKFWLKMGGLVLLFAVILGYSYFKTKDLFKGVRLTVEGLTDGETIDNSFLKISGTAKKAVYVSINDREIFIDSNGVFNDSLILIPGYNIIEIKARGRFGKEKKKVYQIVYK